MQTLEQLQVTHPNYKSVAKQANYYYQSYIGGEQYKAGRYLTQYLGENSGPGDQYLKRINATPLDNHVQTTVDIYRSFLFRDLPRRELGSLTDNPLVREWVMDTDQEGQSMNSFLKTANDLAMVTGSVWILVDKPNYRVETQAEAEALGIRAYACVYTPQNVLDWYYERNVAGKLILQKIKVKEHENDEVVTFTCWYPDYVEKYTASKDEYGNLEDIINYETYENPLGYIPFVHHAPLRSPVKGVGYSLISDVADQQKYIYNLLSELEQTIRISGHPTLAKTPATDATAGAGGIVTMPEDLDPQLKPYLLQPASAGISGILQTIENCVGAIQRMTHTSAVQATSGTPMSGVALQTERQLLNAKLSDLADTLKETEIALWRIWFDWQALDAPEDFHIEYPETFDIRDAHAELEKYKKALELVPHDSFQHYIHDEISRMLVEDPEDLREILEKIAEDHRDMNISVPGEDLV